MSESILWCFAISKKHVSTVKCCYKKLLIEMSLQTLMNLNRIVMLV